MCVEVGTMLVDEDGDEWMVRACSPTSVTLHHHRRGVHRLRRDDLEAWIEAGRWTVTSSPG